ncbi:MAG: PAS domain-containing protein [Candidatus Brocadiales bacterium]
MKITNPKKKCLAEGWTQKMLAEATGRNKSEISMVLNGERFTRSIQKDIALTIGISEEKLFGEWARTERQLKQKEITTGMEGDKKSRQPKHPNSFVVIYSRKPLGNFGITFVGDNVVSLLGYKPQEFTEDSGFWANHIHQEDAARVFAKLPGLFKQGYHILTYRFMHKDGTYRWIHDELKLVRDAAGRPVEIVGCIVDITKQNPRHNTPQEDNFDS